MKKLIAFELEIPIEYTDREDVFVEDLLKEIKTTDNVVTIKEWGHHKGGGWLAYQESLNKIFTGEYEFVDPIKGFS